MVAVWVILAFLLPPLGLHFGGASRIVTGLVSAAWGGGQLVFWLLMAGPGFAISLIASLAAVVMVVRARRRVRT